MAYTFIDYRDDVKMFKTPVEGFEHFDVISMDSKYIAHEKL